MNTQDTQVVVKVTPSIEMPLGTLEDLNKWFNKNFDMVYEKFIRPKLEAEKKEEKGA